MAKRANLSNLSGRLAPKGQGAEQSAASTPAPAAEAPATRNKRQPDGRRGILVRARPEAWKALKQVALDREITLQDLMIEAINDVLQKNGKPPVA